MTPEELAALVARYEARLDAREKRLNRWRDPETGDVEEHNYRNFDSARFDNWEASEEDLYALLSILKGET